MNLLWVSYFLFLTVLLTHEPSMSKLFSFSCCFTYSGTFYE